MNLYKAGGATLTPGLSLPPVYTPVLRRRKDYHTTTGFGTIFPCVNIRRAPFDNILLRYALNMAIDKKAVTDFFGPGFLPARSMVPPLPHYSQPTSLKIGVDGRTFDVLAFDVEGARSLLAKAGFPGGTGLHGKPLEVPHHFPMLPENLPKGEILQRQWLDNLGIRTKLLPHEFNVHWRMVLEADYSGLADYALLPLYRDPNGFLDQFTSDANSNPSAWFDPEYIAELQAANGMLNRTERLNALAACERRLLAAMPVFPVYHPGWGYLCKPFVRGLASHPFDVRAFKYVWIDKNWRPS
jgi:ABC-type transport system substrate-binding protein